MDLTGHMSLLSYMRALIMCTTPQGQAPWHPALGRGGEPIWADQPTQKSASFYLPDCELSIQMGLNGGDQSVTIELARTAA